MKKNKETTKEIINNTREENKKDIYENKRQVIGSVILTIFMFLVGAICGFLIIYMMEKFELMDNSKSFIYMIIGFVEIYIVLLLHIILHEAGHLLFGLFTGYKFSSFRVGSLMFVKTDEKIKLKRHSLAGSGGQCLMAPPELIDGKMPYVLYNMGGVLLNLIIGLICFMLTFVLDCGYFLMVFFLFMAVIGIAYALINGIPLKEGRLDNDGSNVVSLGKNKEALRSFWIQMKVNEHISKGKSISDLPQEWFECPQDEKMKNSMVAVMGVFACNKLMVEHKFKEAYDLMKHILEIDTAVAFIHKKLMICDMVYCELISENRPEELKNMYDSELEKFMKLMKKFPAVIRTQYSYALLAEKDKEKANKIKEQFEKDVKNYPYPKDAQEERNLMEIAEKISKGQ